LTSWTPSKLAKEILSKNRTKPHRSVGKISPLLYYVNNFIGLKKANMMVL